jgi:hypothetical protein
MFWIYAKFFDFTGTRKFCLSLRIYRHIFFGNIQRPNENTQQRTSNEIKTQNTSLLSFLDARILSPSCKIHPLFSLLKDDNRKVCRYLELARLQFSSF